MRKGMKITTKLSMGDFDKELECLLYINILLSVNITVR